MATDKRGKRRRDHLQRGGDAQHRPHRQAGVAPRETDDCRCFPRNPGGGRRGNLHRGRAMTRHPQCLAAGVVFSSSELMQNTNEIVAYGTAVVREAQPGEVTRASGRWQWPPSRVQTARLAHLAGMCRTADSDGAVLRRGMNPDHSSHLRLDARDRRRAAAGIEEGRSRASGSTDAVRCCRATLVREAEPPVRDGAVRRLTFVAGPVLAPAAKERTRSHAV